MDNIENYLYLAFAVIYIVSRILKARSKPKQTPVPNQTQRQPTHRTGKPEPKRTFTFEDILKEFEKNLGGEDEYDDTPEPVPVPEYREQKPQPIPEPNERPSIYETYEGLTYESAEVSEDKQNKDEPVFGGFNVYETEDNAAGEFVKKLRNPDGFKEAFIMSEIINRKY